MKFTQREIEVLGYICQGYSDNEIAKKLIVSLATIKFHVHNLLQKTGSRDRTQLVIFAFNNELVGNKQPYN